MKREEKDKIARNAASTWCRCFKCDGIINDIIVLARVIMLPLPLVLSICIFIEEYINKYKRL